MLIVPFAAALHNTFVELALTVTVIGSVIVTDAVVVQLFTSVTVTVYVPAAKPDAVADVPPVGDHE